MSFLLQVTDQIRSAPFVPAAERPRLLFGTGQISRLRDSAALRPGYLGRLRAKCRKIAATAVEQVDFEDARTPALEAQTMAEGYLLLSDRAWARWSIQRLQYMLNQGNWMPPVHQSSCRHCDHVMGNVAATLAYAHDLLADACTPDESREIADDMRQRILLPFLAGTRERAEWWARAETESNWKIMTCGESGFAFCGYAECWPEGREGLALAARGVIETLDSVPPEGDWPEGVDYWMVTLFMGLRFGSALRRLTAGQVNLFEHPALKTTGDFPLMLTTPAGKTYNFADNLDTLDCEYMADGVRLLAIEARRPDWLALARSYTYDSLLWLAIDDPALPAEPTRRTSARFNRTGVATLRSGWDRRDTFVGLKCGPSDVGHSHLDANSLVLEAQGAPLLIDSGVCPYAAFIGFFELQTLRWNWDHNATVGHSTLLIDGQGQTHGKDYPGRIVGLQSGSDWQTVQGDASECYPGLLSTFIRTVLLLSREIVVIRDVIACQGTRHAAWLMHYAGTVRSEGMTSVVENQGVRLAVTPFLPDRGYGWRVSDTTRTSIYPDQEHHATCTRSVRYRAFEPFRAAESFEFLFGLRVNGDPAGGDWKFTGQAGNWELAIPDLGRSVRPMDHGLAVTAPPLPCEEGEKG